MNLNIFKRETASNVSKESPKKGGSYRENIVFGSSEQGSLNVAAFYRGVDVISNTMSQLIMQYERYNRATDCFVQDFSSDTNFLLQVKPNERMTATQMWKYATQQTILRGNAYIYVDTDAIGKVVGLYLITPGCCTYNILTNTYNISDAINAIALSDVPPQKVIHLRNTFSMDGGLTGVSTLRYAGRALNIACTNDQLTLDNAAKGGRMKLIIQQKQDASIGMGKYAKSEMEKVTEKLNESIYQEDVSFLNGEADITTINMNAADMQILESKKFSVAEIARFLGVPRTILMDDSNSNYNTSEMATLEFVTRTLAPRIREIESEFNAKLLTPTEFGKHRFHFCEKNLFALDRKSQSEYNEKRLATGTASVNELRKEMNMPRIQNGDDYYVSCNIAPVGSDKINGTTTTTEKGGAE